MTDLQKDVERRAVAGHWGRIEVRSDVGEGRMSRILAPLVPR